MSMVVLLVARFCPSPSDPVRQVNKGLQLLEEGRIGWNDMFSCEGNSKAASSAAVCFAHASELAPGASYPRFMQAFCYAIGGDVYAVRWVLKDVPMSDADPEVSALLGWSYEQSGLRQKAIACYAEMLLAEPVALKSDFFASIVRRDSTLSASALKEALRLASQRYADSDDPTEESKWAALLFWSGDTDEALPLLYQVRKRMPNYSRPHYYLGRLAEASGDTMVAMAEYRKAAVLGLSDSLPDIALSRLQPDRYMHRPTYGYMRSASYLRIAYQTDVWKGGLLQGIPFFKLEKIYD